MQDLHELPKLRDSLSYLYVERAIVEREDYAVVLLNQEGRTLVPTAALCLLILGPGQVSRMQRSRCWQRTVARCYGQGRRWLHCTRRGWGDAQGVPPVAPGGAGMRPTEAGAGGAADVLEALRTGDRPRVEPGAGAWAGRNAHAAGLRAGEPGARGGLAGAALRQAGLGQGDPINRALSAANALLNGICHAAIVSGGYSPALGFIHTGKQLSFVYDIADLYKTEVTIPMAFKIVGQSSAYVEAR